MMQYFSVTEGGTDEQGDSIHILFQGNALHLVRVDIVANVQALATMEILVKKVGKFENTQWRKAKNTHKWRKAKNTHNGKVGKFENTQWRKAKNTHKWRKAKNTHNGKTQTVTLANMEMIFKRVGKFENTQWRKAKNTHKWRNTDSDTGYHGDNCQKYG